MQNDENIQATDKSNKIVEESNVLAENQAEVLPKATGATKKLHQHSVTEFLPKKITQSQQKKIDSSFLKLFIKDLQPFRIVEDEGFKEFVSALNPNYVLPSRKKISNTLVPALYEKTVNETKELLKTVRACGLTTDCWTSCNNEGYIGVTVHFVNEDFKACSKLLGCVCFNESHTAVNLSEQLKNLTEEYEVFDKIVLATPDKALNIQSALDFLKWKQVGCLAQNKS